MTDQRGPICPPLSRLPGRRRDRDLVKIPFGGMYPPAFMTSLSPVDRGAFFYTAMAFEQELVAASVSTSLLPKLASCHPPLDSAGVPVGDGLRPIDAQF